MKNGWFKVYWDFLDKLTPESALLLAYLIEIEPIMKNRDGDYFRLSNSFIQERFLTWSDYIIKTKLDELVEKGYIEQQQKFKVEHSRGCKTRWVKIKFNPEDNPEDNPNNKPKNFGIKETKETKETEEKKETYGETSSPTKKKSPSAKSSSSKGKSRKDQLVEYVQATSFADETKDTLYQWIFTIGLKGGVTVEQLRAKLKDVWESCNGNESLIREVINNAYLNNWFGFFNPARKQANFSEKKSSSHLTLDKNKNPAQPNAQGSRPKLNPNVVF